MLSSLEGPQLLKIPKPLRVPSSPRGPQLLRIPKSLGMLSSQGLPSSPSSLQFPGGSPNPWGIRSSPRGPQTPEPHEDVEDQAAPLPAPALAVFLSLLMVFLSLLLFFYHFCGCCCNKKWERYRLPPSAPLGGGLRLPGLGLGGV